MRIVIIGLISLIMIFGIGIGILVQSPSTTPEKTLFKVEKGETLNGIFKHMEERQIIRSSLILRTYLWITRQELSFQAGTYELPANKNLFELTSILKTLQPVLFRVTIPEGLTLTKTAKLLEEKNIIRASDFLQASRSPQLLSKWNIRQNSFEGYLFPDTYYFPPDARPEQIIDLMVSNFKERFKAMGLGSDFTQGRESLILASIVEREYQIDSEAPLIASVFVNRLHRRIPLASCATIEYILTEIQGKPHPKRIYFNNTQIPSPYNTYLNRGLPPTPICNPGLTALRAAFKPSTSDYLFFVVENKETGSHKFSNSFAQHEKAREDYLNSFVSKN